MTWRQWWHKYRGMIGFVILAFFTVLALYLAQEERIRAREFDAKRAETICMEANNTRTAIRTAFVEAGASTKEAFTQFTNVLIETTESRVRTEQEQAERVKEIKSFRSGLEKQLTALDFTEVQEALEPRDCSGVAEEVEQGGK